MSEPINAFVCKSPGMVNGDITVVEITQAVMETTVILRAGDYLFDCKVRASSSDTSGKRIFTFAAPLRFHSSSESAMA